MNFKLHSEFAPSGDQPSAIKQLVEGLNRGDKAQVLLGVTGSGKPYTIAMRYHPYLSSGEHHVTDPSSYAVTFHYDIQHPTNPIQTILLCDGTGRLLQTKKDAEVEGVPMLLNSGLVEYDCFGRTVKQYYPFARDLTDTVYINHFDAATLTTTTYDILDRPLKVILPTLDSAKTSYGFGAHGGKTYFRTTSTDPKGTAVTTLTGTRKQQVKTIAPLGAVTTFAYSPLGQLLSSTDPCNHTTTYTYDMLGRLLSRTHPDAGTDTYTYDGAGNVTTHSTQVLANANKTINYYYTYNRLDSIVYPTNRQNNVRYTYGDSTATHNQRGRIALMEDASGFQTFFYGRMGEVTENNRTFVLPNENQPYSFKMKYSYDSWNRVQDITYPDGEVVHYKYNTGGMLRQVQGQRSFFSGLDSVIIGPFDPLNPREDEYDDPTADNAPDFDTTGMGDRATYHNYLYNYITDIRYNEFELKSGQWYGNGTHAHYAYDILQRLSHLTAYNSANNAMQDISYTYDKASNIIQISNAAGVVNTLGDTYSYSYTYDSLYRLTSSYGSIGSGKPLAYYNLNMQYEADGRITYKNQSGRTRLNGTVQTFNDSKSYTYNTSQPHTVQSISGTNYQWDANGNMTNDGGAALTWDEENRLTSHSKSFHRTCFFYDASGERYYKNTGSNMMLVVNGVWQMMTLYTNPTLYTSPYIVATKDGYTKHYYVESERFASRIGDGTITSLNTHATTASALAAKQVQVNDAAPDSVQPNKLSNLLSLPFNWSAHHTTYWQHSDHLGSASWVTDTNGTAYQHLQYMPWGEPLLDQRKSGYTYNTRYTFSGKERDEETGYSYFGARYYHSTLSIWLSVDPMADKYPGVSPYTYCANNPVRLVDPDGREVGNYYDICGNYLGTDGNDDGEVYILTSAHDIDLAESNNSNGFHTAVEEFHSPMRIPFAETRNEIVNGLIERDGENCFAESGCIYGQDTHTGKEVVRWAQMGPTIDPRTGETASVNYNTADRNLFIPYGTAHGHCSGEIGNSSFIQAPSDVDRQNSINNIAKFHQMTSAYFVVALRDCQVHLYDYQGNNATMSIDLFLNLK